MVSLVFKKTSRKDTSQNCIFLFRDISLLREVEKCSQIGLLKDHINLYSSSISYVDWKTTATNNHMYLAMLWVW